MQETYYQATHWCHSRFRAFSCIMLLECLWWIFVISFSLYTLIIFTKLNSIIIIINYMLWYLQDLFQLFRTVNPPISETLQNSFTLSLTFLCYQTNFNLFSLNFSSRLSKKKVFQNRQRKNKWLTTWTK